MKHATSIALHEYWRSCHANSGVSAGQIQAAELIPLLPSLFLIDLPRAAAPRFRFCGPNLIRRYGRDLAGESFLDVWQVEDRTAVERHLQVVSMRSAGFVAGVMAETMGAGFTCFELLMLPLLGSSGTAGAIGSMERVGGHEEMNRIRARLVSQSLRSVRFLPAPGPSSSPFSLSGCIPPAPRPNSTQSKPRLSLVPGGKSGTQSFQARSLTET